MADEYGNGFTVPDGIILTSSRQAPPPPRTASVTMAGGLIPSSSSMREMGLRSVGAVLSYREWERPRLDQAKQDLKEVPSSEPPAPKKGLYCADCKWSVIIRRRGEKRLGCQHPRVPEFENGQLHEAVNEMRMFNRCGPEAKWFEPKSERTSWWRRLFA